MNILAESHIPCLRGLLEPHACVEYRDVITASDVREADVLLVRTRTHCDAALLRGSRVRFIGTATIGTDHIDLDYCRQHGIEVVNAPGCNAPAVAQWVLAAIGQWMAARGIARPDALTLAVVGVGHVGSIVARWARQLGFRVLACDPPRAEREGANGFATMEQVAAQADIITFHTPLTRSGRWPTWHLCDTALLHTLRHCRLLLNAARGAVCDTEALLRWPGDLAIDCWEGEPHISQPLLERSFVATPHIAGYSLQGKQRGTAMVVEALGTRFGWDLQPVQASTPLLGADHVTLPGILDTYNPLADTATLRQNPDRFEQLRNTYPLRNEV
ncbi:MAG: 4-phosphoerythronate dehydrogenase [Muribaculaceae bacterium]|nr:4-phosphoerythronate dehydrogenase [Muribaculaceae bacterium]